MSFQIKNKKTLKLKTALLQPSLQPTVSKVLPGNVVKAEEESQEIGQQVNLPYSGDVVATQI